MVLPRGLTWAKPSGNTVATRQTFAGNAVSICSWRTFGIVPTRPSLATSSASTTGRTRPRRTNGRVRTLPSRATSATSADLEGDGVAQACIGVAQRERVAPGPWFPEQRTLRRGQCDAVENPLQPRLPAIGLEGHTLPTAGHLRIDRADRAADGCHDARAVRRRRRRDGDRLGAAQEPLVARRLDLPREGHGHAHDAGCRRRGHAR